MEKLGKEFEAHVIYVNTIEKSASGKLKFVINETGLSQ